VLAFRRAESPMTTASFQLQDLESTGVYTFECADGGQPLQITGHDLMTKGLPIVIDSPRSSRLLFFRKLL